MEIDSFNSDGLISEKQRTWDCSVILGALYGGTPNQFVPEAAAMYPPSNTDILNTTAQTMDYFKTAFPLNAEDDKAGVPGTLLGRYKDDKYPGCDSQGGSGGHAWILCSNALAELYYRNALYFHAANPREGLSAKAMLVISDLVEKDLPTASQYLRDYVSLWKEPADLGEEEMQEITENIAAMFMSQGDGQLQRVAKYVKPCQLRMSEQFCEDTAANGGGQEIGAHDLTWSYGTVLSAMYYRDQAQEMGVRQWDQSVNDRVHWDAFGAQENCGGNICSGQCHD